MIIPKKYPAEEFKHEKKETTFVASF